MKGPQILFQNGALSQGSNLWVTSNTKDSYWNSKLDWYLNFQLARAKVHRVRELNPKFSERLAEYNIHVSHSSATPDLLMVACNHLLPTSMLVQIPFAKDFKSWTQEIHKVWTQLLKPSIRIFLPQDFPIEQFATIWPVNEDSNITLVPYQKSGQG